MISSKLLNDTYNRMRKEIIMRKLKRVGLFMSALVITIGFVGCGLTDDENNLVGIWELTKEDLTQDGYKDVGDKDVIVMKFGKNKKAYRYDKHNPDSKLKDFAYDWKIRDDKTIRLSVNGKDDDFYTTMKLVEEIGRAHV